MSKYLIVGLGNIGSEYADTRHNAGFMVADELVRKAGASFSVLRYSYYAEFKTKGRTVVVIKPTTYMNLSGKAVSYWMQMLKIPLEHVLVVVDDLAIPFGKVRLRSKGSSAGHNGLKSIEMTCGSQLYARLRFGIGDHFSKGRQVDYVLAPFDDTEQAELPGLIGQAVQMTESFVIAGVELTMNRFNNQEI